MGIDASMFVRTMAKVTKGDLRRLSWEACALFGSSKFFIQRSDTEPRHALSRVDKWEQDGPDIRREKGETFVAVHMWTRYWGPGYERGDLPFILTLAEWLERKFPEGAVWYGGDSSGVCAAPFNRRARAKLLDHAASPAGVDYRMGHSIGGDGSRCEFCDAPMSQCRWGAGKTGYVCLGCNLHRLVPDTAGAAATEAVGHWPDEKRAS